MNNSVKLVGVTGHDLSVLGSTQLSEVNLGIITVIIVEGINHPMILGRDCMQSLNMKVDYANRQLAWQNKALPLLPVTANPELASVGDRPTRVADSKIQECINNNQHVFATKGQALGCHPEIMVRIETEGRPVKRRPYRIPLAKRTDLDEKLDDMLAQGIIIPSSSPWASPVVLVDKKDPSDGLRFTVDYTALNKQTKKDAYPIPLIRDIFDQLQGATIFSTLDLKSGFHQLPIHPDDREKTAFVCHRGLFEWTRLPMGLSNASQMFERVMEIVLKGLIGTICLLYIDDIVVFSKSEEAHATHLQTMFDRLAQYNLTLNPSKCVFGQQQVKLLGYMVSKEGLMADPAKVDAIARLESPKNVSEVRTFLGMTGYYRTLIKEYAKTAEPLVNLTRKNVRFSWSPQHQEAFELLKHALMSDNIMAHPKPDQPYLLYTDACEYAIGAILCQLDDKGIERPVVYLSKQLSTTQRKWATIEKEAYAVVHALKTLRPYLWGASYKCYTDHKPLTSLFCKDMNNTKIQRWGILLAEYNCKVEYHKGKLNVRADMLSRIKQSDTINTFDADYWHLGDSLPQLPQDEQLPDIYGLDLNIVAQQQRLLPEWSEHDNEQSPYVRINGLLYSTQRPYKYAPDHPRLVLPPEQRRSVIAKAHKEVGHMSVVKTMRRAQQAFVWPSMKSDITNFIKSCPTCVIHSKRSPKTAMGEMPIATSPVQIVAMDLIGPLVASPEGNVYALTIIDHCTGWAEAYPIPTKSSKEVWKQLSRFYFPRHGYPNVMISDLGLEFSAIAFKSYLQDLGIDHRQTTSYNPQTNGKCEKFNSTLKAIVTKLINNQRADWEDKLGPALMAYNNAVSDVTGHTPFFLHHARRARLPITRLLGPNAQHQDERLTNIAQALNTAITETAASRHYNRQRLLRQANQGVIKVGDSVVIKAPEPLTLTSTWDPQWTVTGIRGKVVQLIHQQTSRTKKLNINKVKVVDPNIVWDQLNPRPVRNSRVSTRVTGLNRMPRLDAPPPIATPQTSQPTARDRQTAKRKRNEAERAHPPVTPDHTPEPHNIQAQTYPASVEPQPGTSKQLDLQPPSLPPSSNQEDGLDSEEESDTAPCPTPGSRTPATARKAKQSGQLLKKLHRQATRRPHSPQPLSPAKRAAHSPERQPQVDSQPTPPSQLPRPHKSTTRTAPTRHEDLKRLHRRPERRRLPPLVSSPAKRTRPFLPRGTKRPLLTGVRKPSPQVQKKARIDLIDLVSWHTSQ